MPSGAILKMNDTSLFMVLRRNLFIILDVAVLTRREVIIIGKFQIDKLNIPEGGDEIIIKKS
jgi:hypothetical protein